MASFYFTDLLSTASFFSCSHMCVGVCVCGCVLTKRELFYRDCMCFENVFECTLWNRAENGKNTFRRQKVSRNVVYRFEKGKGVKDKEFRSCCSMWKDNHTYICTYMCLCVCWTWLSLWFFLLLPTYDDECDDDGIAIILIQLTCNPLTVHVSGGLTSISVPLWMTASPALPVVVRSSCETGGHRLWSDKSVQVDERAIFMLLLLLLLLLNVSLSFCQVLKSGSKGGEGGSSALKWSGVCGLEVDTEFRTDHFQIWPAYVYLIWAYVKQSSPHNLLCVCGVCVCTVYTVRDGVGDR